MNDKKIFYILGLSFFVKIALALLVPVYADEAYYYVWTLHPQLSYFDHPPMVSWFIYLGNLIFPFHNSLSLRSIFILASMISMCVWVKILRHKKFSETSIIYFLILMALNPLLGPGSIIATPDLPLVFFWSLSYLCFLVAFENKSYLAYSLLGISLGLGFCSKYHIVLFVISGLVYLVITKKIREIRPLGALLTILFGFLFSLPVIVWNYHHEWASFAYQLNHGFGRNYYEWDWTASFILGQILILNPFLLPELFKKSKDRTDQIFSLTQFLFFLSSSFKSVVEANWPITSHLHGAAAASSTLSSNRMKYASAYWVLIYAIFATILLTPLRNEILKNQISSNQLKEIVPLVEQFQPLYGPNYQVSSLLTWMSGQNIYKLNGLARPDLNDSLPESIPTQKEFFVLKHTSSIWPEMYNHYTITKLKVFEDQQLELFRMNHE